ncbi:MAG: helix-turn-helix transcriptional regulator [Oscillospiraceae bacterium]|nr:helix-turn-helix transcriptional regulator [Oscillospiraceae bacterium]
MRVNMLGWNWKHPDTLSIVRPEGIHGMQIVLVRSKARVKMGDREYRVEKNTAFVMESCYPHCLFADGEAYVDDWIRFDLEDDDTEFLKALGIGFNVPIRLDSDAVSELIRLCEMIWNAGGSEKEATVRLLMRAIFLQIKSCYDETSLGRTTHYDAELEAIRQQIYAAPANDWNIPLIARKLSLSAVHFQRLYKQRYGISCTRDILTSRMELAKQLLLRTELSADEISRQCGYADYSHFSKAFMKYACVSPAKYRKENRQK